jgi:hypothetical protein
VARLYTVTSIATGAAQGPQRPVRQRRAARRVAHHPARVGRGVLRRGALPRAPAAAVATSDVRLAAGDLGTRVGATLAVRSDDGDLVRDFDAMAERIETVQSQSSCCQTSRTSCDRPGAPQRCPRARAARRRRGAVDLDRIEAEAARMNDMVGSLLELSRVGAIVAPGS